MIIFIEKENPEKSIYGTYYQIHTMIYIQNLRKIYYSEMNFCTLTANNWKMKLRRAVHV